MTLRERGAGVGEATLQGALAEGTGCCQRRERRLTVRQANAHRLAKLAHEVGLAGRRRHLRAGEALHVSLEHLEEHGVGHSNRQVGQPLVELDSRVFRIELERSYPHHPLDLAHVLGARVREDRAVGQERIARELAHLHQRGAHEELVPVPPGAQLGLRHVPGEARLAAPPLEAHLREVAEEPPVLRRVGHRLTDGRRIAPAVLQQTVRAGAA